MLLTAACLSLVLAADTLSLDRAVFRDKLKGAWAGQMIGVAYGWPYEFRSNGAPILGDLEAWKPERVHNAIEQDDCYVEMTFLEALEDHGLDITPVQAGAAFGASQYPLWHANRIGRDNIRRGIYPPLSGHPEFNHHADDIDFQIEADLFGILCPGLPRESNRLCNIFGRIMNYGDGLYGGMFVAGMYAAAYFESSDVRKVIGAGLACIPAESLYARCIRDVIGWHAEHPTDWLAAWQKIEDKWQDDVDCGPGNAFNIDAKLNGAYIVMGLLYGGGDFGKTIEISTRCGQDADCNPSNAAGILGCMKGYKALGRDWTGGIDEIARTPFSHTRYGFNDLIRACERMTASIVERAGGTVTRRAFQIPRQTAEAPELEQWIAQERTLSLAVPRYEAGLWQSGWSIQACGPYMDPGLHANWGGRANVFVVHPVNRDEPGVLEGPVLVPDREDVVLTITTASSEKGDYELRIQVEDRETLTAAIDTKGAWVEVPIDVSAHRGKTIKVRLENHANGWSNEAAYFATVAAN